MEVYIVAYIDGAYMLPRSKFYKTYKNALKEKKRLESKTGEKLKILVANEWRIAKER